MFSILTIELLRYVLTSQNKNKIPLTPTYKPPPPTYLFPGYRPIYLLKKLHQILSSPAPLQSSVPQL